MSDDTNFNAGTMGDVTDTSLCITYTQIATCIVGRRTQEKDRQKLRAKLERERLEREQRLQDSFVTTFRNLFRGTPT